MGGKTLQLVTVTFILLVFSLLTFGMIYVLLGEESQNTISDKTETLFEPKINQIEINKPDVSPPVIDTQILDEVESNDVDVIIKYKGTNDKNSKKKKSNSANKLVSSGVSFTEHDAANSVSTTINKEILEDISNDPNIESINKDNVYYATLSQTSDIIGITYAHNYQFDGSGVTIAVLDTGINGTQGVDFTGLGDTRDYNGHGTVAKTIINQISPNAKILNIKVLNSEGIGYESDILQGVDFALANNADIVLMAFGGPYEYFETPLHSAIENLVNQDVVVVASSGNCATNYCGSFNGVTVPGNSPFAITFGSVDEELNHADFSSGKNYGRYIKPDVVTPGVDIEVGENTYSGTSISAQIGAASLALVKSAGEELKPAEIKSLVEFSATDLGTQGKDLLYGAGIINVSLMIEYIQEARQIPMVPESNEENLQTIEEKTPINFLQTSPDYTNVKPSENSKPLSFEIMGQSPLFTSLTQVLDIQPVYYFGERMDFRVKGTAGMSALNDPNQIYEECQFLGKPNNPREELNSPEFDAAILGTFKEIEVGTPLQFYGHYIVLAKDNGKRTFYAQLICLDSDVIGSEDDYYSDWGSRDWEAQPDPGCIDKEVGITLGRVEGTTGNVVYSVTIENNLCDSDYTDAYSQYIDEEEYELEKVVPAIPPKTSYGFDDVEIETQFSTGTHNLEVCLNSDGLGGVGECDDQYFSIVGECIDNPGVIDACLDYPKGHTCEGDDECQVRYCVLGYCSDETYFCGNDVCESAESPLNCPVDCQENEIICTENIDCGESGPINSPYCSADGNVYQITREYTCRNPGTTQSSCYFFDTDNLVEICDSECISGQCSADISCFTDNDCPDSYIGQTQCVEDNVWQNYRTGSCTFAGTPQSFCEYNEELELKLECNAGCSDGFCQGLSPYEAFLEGTNQDFLYKQPGDFITFTIKSERSQKVSFTYPKEALPASTQIEESTVRLSSGEHQIKFIIDESTDEKFLHFSTGGKDFVVSVINNPEVVTLTDSEALDQQFGSFDSSKTNVNQVLDQAYAQMSERYGIVYDLANYDIGERPWVRFGNYNEKPLSPKITNNDYAIAASALIQDKCGNCKHTMILGDDFVVPHLRREITEIKGNWWWTESQSSNIYSDFTYVSRKDKTFDQIGTLFNDNNEAKDVLFVYPYDDTSDYILEELEMLKDTIQDKFEVASVSSIDSNEIGCNSHNKLEGKTLIIIGTEENNNALKCMPFVAQFQGLASIDRNVWDTDSYSIILNTKDGVADPIQFIRVIADDVTKAEDLKLTGASFVVACLFDGKFQGEHATAQEISCNFIPIVELVVDARDSIKCIVNSAGTIIQGEWDPVDEFVCTVTHAATGYDYATWGAALFTFGATGVGGEVFDGGIATFKVVLKKVVLKVKDDNVLTAAIQTVKSSPHLLKGVIEMIAKTPSNGEELTHGGILLLQFEEPVITDTIKFINRGELSRILAGTEIENLGYLFKAEDEIKLSFEGLKDSEIVTASKLFEKGHLLNHYKDTTRRLDVEKFVDIFDGSGTINIRMNQDSWAAFYLSTNKQIFINPSPSQEYKKLYFLVHPNQNIRQNAKDLYLKSGTQLAEELAKYGSKEYETLLRLHKTDAIINSFPHELVHFKIHSLFLKETKSYDELLGLPANAFKKGNYRLYAFEEVFTDLHTLNKLKNTPDYDTYLLGIKRRVEPYWMHLENGEINQESREILVKKLIEEFKNPQLSTSDFYASIAWQKLLAKKSGVSDDMLNDYDNVLTEVFTNKDINIDPDNALIRIYSIEQEMDKNLDGVLKLLDKGSATQADIDEFTQYMRNVYEKVSLNAHYNG